MTDTPTLSEEFIAGKFRYLAELVINVGYSSSLVRRGDNCSLIEGKFLICKLLKQVSCGSHSLNVSYRGRTGLRHFRLYSVNDP